MSLRFLQRRVAHIRAAVARMWEGNSHRPTQGGPHLPSFGKCGAAIALVLMSALLLMAAGTDDPGGKRFDRLGHAVMCQCGCGQVMLECNHVGCASSEQMRKELKAAMDSGQSDQEILAGFVSKYGPTVLSAPTNTGFNLVAWIMPIVITIAALLAVTLVVRAWKRRAPATTAAIASDSNQLDDFRRRAREETDL
jgi:cytochrome c-type biogenesis protein CcmH/NrfF